MVTRHALQAMIPKERLAALADELGLQRNGWELRCPLPGHDDSRFSAGVFPVPASDDYGSPAHGRWKCQPCRRGGDALELVMQARPDWGNAAAEAWLVDWLATNPAPPSATGKRTRERFDPSEARKALANRDDTLDLTRLLFDCKGIVGSASWVVRRWRLGSAYKHRRWCLVMPYLRRSGGKVKAVHAKRRFPVVTELDGINGTTTYEWEKRWYPGQRPKDGMLFGEHLDRGQTTVVIAEGETDVIALDVWLRSPRIRERVFGSDRPVLVLGWPDANAQPTDRLLDLLAGRRIVLIPDRDDSQGQGVACAERWAAALAQVGCKRPVVAALPPGQDACTAGRTAVVAALRKAANARNRRERRAHLQ